MVYCIAPSASRGFVGNIKHNLIMNYNRENQTKLQKLVLLLDQLAGKSSFFLKWYLEKSQCFLQCTQCNKTLNLSYQKLHVKFYSFMFSPSFFSKGGGVKIHIFLK